MFLLFITVSSNAQTPCFAQFTFSPNPNGTSGFVFTPAIQNWPGVTYNWSFGDGTTSNQMTPTHTYQQNGTYTACLVVWYQNCSDTSCVTITVGTGGGGGGNCQAWFNWNNLGTANLFMFNDQSSGQYSDVFWTMGDGATYDTVPVFHTYNAPGTYTVCLYLLDSAGNACDSICRNVVVQFGGNQCNASFTYAPDSLAGQNCYSFTNTSTGNFTNVQWDFGDGTTSNAANPNHCFPGPGCYIVCLSVYDSLQNCWDQTCVTILIHGGGTGNCQANFSHSSMPNQQTVAFSDNSTGNPYNWFWDFGDNQVSNQQNPIHQYSQPGAYVVCLTITSSNSPVGNVCTSTYCDTVIVTGMGGGPCFDPSVIDSSVACITIFNPVCGCDSITYPSACVAYYHHGITSWTPGPCGNNNLPCFANFQYTFAGTSNTLSFFANGSSNINYWEWIFGDGTVGYGMNPTHTYTNPGVYTVCLIAVDTNNIACCDTVCQTITIQGGGGGNCLSLFSVTPDSSGYLFNFSDQSLGNPTQWTWTFPGGTPSGSSAQNPTVVYNTPGTYQACLAIYDSISGCTNTSCQTITVGPSTGNCQAYFNATQVPGSPFTVIFTDASLGMITSWSWDFGDNTIGTGQNPVHTYNAPGTYIVCLTVVAATPMGTTCTSTYCDTIVVTQGGGNCIDPTVIDTTVVCPTVVNPVCGCDSVTYVNACVAYNYHGVTQWTPGPCGQSNPCNAAFQYTTAGSANSVMFFNGSSGNITSYHWTFGDGTSSSLPNPTHTYASPGTYLVCLIVTDFLANCTDTFCMNVTVGGGGGGCQASFNAVPDSSGLGMTFFNTSTGNPASNFAYHWDFGDGTTSNVANPYHQYSTAGIYLVCLTVTDNTGCTDTYCYVVNITGGNPCAPTFYMFPDSLIFGSGTVHFIGINNCNVQSWYWTFGDSTSSTLQNPIHQYNQTGWYWVCVNVTLLNGQTFQHCDSIYALRLFNTGITEDIVDNLELKNYPNPFESTTNVSYQLVGNANVEMSVYNLLGEKITSIVDQQQSAGQYTFEWDATPYEFRSLHIDD